MLFRKDYYFILGIFFGLLACEKKENQEAIDPADLPRSTPESQGVSSAGLMKMLDKMNAAEEEFHTLMIVRNGNVILEADWTPYGIDLKRQLYSLSKSFTSTAIGLAIEERLLTLDDQVYRFFPDELPSVPSENLKKMKISHLLTMATGQDGDQIETLMNSHRPWVETFLAQPVINEPGSVFQYNTAATYMLSAILQKVTSETTAEYLKTRLFEPLGIRHYEWLTNKEGINVGGYGLRLSTESIAKLGQLYLQKGMWNGTQLLNPSWVEAASSIQIASADDENGDYEQGYGYQFWQNEPSGFRGDGAFGQYCIVLPAYDAVVAMTSNTDDSERTLKYVWDYLLPLFEQTEVLEDNEDLRDALNKKIRRLKIQPTRYRTLTPLALEVSENTYILEENEFGTKFIQFNFDTNICKIKIGEANGQISQVDAGFNNWARYPTNVKTLALSVFAPNGRVLFPSRIAANVTWVNDNKMLLEIKYIETCHSDNWTCEFKDDQVFIDFEDSELVFGEVVKRDRIIGNLLRPQTKN